MNDLRQLTMTEIDAMLRANGWPCLGLIENVSCAEFSSALAEARVSNPHGAYLTAYSENELQETCESIFLSEDKNCGIAVQRDGNITALFKSGQSQMKCANVNLLVAAIAHGGKKLDCFDGILPQFYTDTGFIPVAKINFDIAKAPPDWNYKRDGNPEIIFWRHNGDSPQEVIRKIHSYPPHDLHNLPTFKEYQEAYIYRDSLID